MCRSSDSVDIWVACYAECVFKTFAMVIYHLKNSIGRNFVFVVAVMQSFIFTTTILGTLL